jgi:hypothetical protein
MKVHKMTPPQTGPRTEAGKFNSSRNALAHGLTATNIDRFPAAMREEFAQFLARQREEWRPATHNEEIFVERYAFSQFQVLRAQALEAHFAGEFFANPADPVAAKRFQNFTRYLRNAERAAKEALKELRTFIADRLASVDADAALAEVTEAGNHFPKAFPHHLVTAAKTLRQTPEGTALRYACLNQKMPPTISATEAVNSAS